MFSAIAGTYDLLNHLLSFNQDIRWRHEAALIIKKENPKLVLDVAGGTGDLGLAIKRQNPQATVLVSDFTHAMLRLAPEKFTGTNTSFVTADGLGLPFPDNSFDALSIGFGLRNLPSRPKGLTEFFRVLKPGGLLLVLEFSQPEGPLFGPFYRTYLKKLLPSIGDFIGKSRFHAYSYLARTVGDFPPAKDITEEITACGYCEVNALPMTGGIVAIHTAKKPA